MAIFPQLFTSKDPNFADLTKARQLPSAEALFGYDAQGYDVYTRTVYGARASVSVGILATAFTLIFGSAVGDHCRLPRRLARLGDRANCRDFPGDSDIPRWTPVPLHVPQRDRHPIRDRRRQGRFRHRDPCLAHDHEADARQRAPGQAERLRASSTGAGRLALAHHHRPHPAQFSRLGDRCFHHQPWRLHFPGGFAVLPGSRSAAARHLVGQS